MISMKLIGIGYKAQQGKTTFAYALANQLALRAEDKRIVVYNFSDAVSATARAIGVMGLPKVNRTLQVVGELYRLKDPEYWINQLLYRIHDDEPDVGIVAGLRHRNECDWIKSWKHDAGFMPGSIINIKRVLKNGTQFVDTQRNTQHVTETELDSIPEAAWDFNVTIPEGDLDEIYNSANLVAKSLFDRWDWASGAT